MDEKVFDRESMARWYANQHLKMDPGTTAVYYLPSGAPEREIRFLEVNESMAERVMNPLEPLDFGVRIDGLDRHQLMVVDVTPNQWEKIARSEISLPSGWSLEHPVVFRRGPS